MRPYFKNDLYNYALLQQQNTLRDKMEKEAAVAKDKAIVSRPKKELPVDDSLTIDIHKETAVIEAPEEDEDEEVLKSFKKKQNRQNRNIFSNAYKPKSNLTAPETKTDPKTDSDQRQQRKQYNFFFKDLKTEMKVIQKKIREEQKKQEDQKDKTTVEKDGTLPKDQANKDKDKKDAQKQQNKKCTESQKKPESEDAAEPKQKTYKTEGKKKTKFIKKQSNYVRLDLKRKYKDRFLGALNNNIRRYGPNGRLKPKYRAQSQLTLEDGQVYNTYIGSLSRALCTTICIDQDSDDDSVVSDKEPERVPTEWTHETLTDYLQRAFGFQSFREGQYQTIQNILNAKSTVFISETASGKSLTYIMSSMLMGGLSLVISPLVSLMLDQLSHLPDSLPAACISSLLNRDQKERIVKMVQDGRINLLFLTPECLQTDFIYHLQDFPAVNFTCIDEAHSLSELSHNFRTSFLALGDIVQNLIKYKQGTPTILGLTATANPETVTSIQAKLNINQLIRSTRCLNKNLYVTISRERGMSKCESLIRYLNHQQIVKCKGILIYARTRKIMGEVLNYITNSTSFRVAIYHSALTNKEKTDTLNKFREGEIKIVVATVALGMGLDFSDLECVIHMNMPKSIENYVQEIGRAGRRQKRAYCHLFLDESDYFTERNYIIADEIESSMLHLLYHTLRENSVYNKPNHPKTDREKNRREDKKLAAKRAAMVQKQQKRQEELLKYELEKSVDKPLSQQQKSVIKRCEIQMAIRQQQEVIYEQEDEDSYQDSPAEIQQAHFQEQQLVVKRASILIAQNQREQAIYQQQQEENQDSCSSQQDPNFPPNPKVNTRLFYTRVAKLTESTQLREQAVLTLLLKIQSLLKTESVEFKVLPIANESVKIGFFKNNEDALKKQNPFLRELMAGCKKVKGTTYINLIDKCNSMGFRPIYLLTQLYRLGHEHYIKIQQQTPVFVWQFSGRKRTAQLEQDEELSQLVQRGFNKLLGKQEVNRVIHQMNEVQNVSLLKLNALYSLAFNHSRNHISNVLVGHIIPPEVPIPAHSISAQFDHYFKDNLHHYYDRITDKGLEVYIPSEMIISKDIEQIYSSVVLFMKHEMGTMDIRNDREILQARKKLLLQYGNGKVITKIFMGINSGEVSWKIYGERSYWMFFRRKNYAELLETVQGSLQRYSRDYVDRESSNNQTIVTFD